VYKVINCVCEAWSLTLREEHRLRAFENSVLRRIFGSKRNEVTRGWRILHNEGLHNLYSLPSIIRMIKSRRLGWAGHVARMGEKRNSHRKLVERPEGKRLLEDQDVGRWTILKWILREIVWDGMDWINLAQDRDQ
jgi:hypothetical protein